MIRAKLFVRWTRYGHVSVVQCSDLADCHAWLGAALARNPYTFWIDWL